MKCCCYTASHVVFKCLQLMAMHSICLLLQNVNSIPSFQRLFESSKCTMLPHDIYVFWRNIGMSVASCKMLLIFKNTAQFDDIKNTETSLPRSFCCLIVVIQYISSKIRGQINLFQPSRTGRQSNIFSSELVANGRHSFHKTVMTALYRNNLIVIITWLLNTQDKKANKSKE